MPSRYFSRPLLRWISLLLALPLSEPFTSGSLARSRWANKCVARSSSPPIMASLNTAWEWLAEERLEVGEEAYGELKWIDPTAETQLPLEFSKEQQQSWDHVPLYPIPAVYLPVAGVNHTLNNVEPRNIQMAMDLTETGSDGLFCLALRAADTGRIARVGTLMKLLHIEPHPGSEDGSISRIVVTCAALEPVTINAIDNGQEAESRISKLMRSPVYLKASLSSRRTETSTQEGTMEEAANHLVKDYEFVRSMYVDGIGQEEVPMFARENLGKDLPEKWTPDVFSTESSFWTASFTWQKLCNTVREGRQVDLSADRNEIMIEAASQQGGILKLPIHLEDLPPIVQRQVQQMEVDRQKEFALECRMDPVLDFLVLLQMRSLSDRTRQLARMVARERDRLTTAALFTRSEGRTKESETVEPPQKGAWFEEGF